VAVVGPVFIRPPAGNIPAWLVSPVMVRLRPVRSSIPLPVATTLLPCCVSVTTYPACAGGVDRPEPINVATPSAAGPATRFTNVMPSPDPFCT
jgi:hypothetical protein